MSGAEADVIRNFQNGKRPYLNHSTRNLNFTSIRRVYFSTTFSKTNHNIRKNVIMKEKKLSHLYDGHAKSCYNRKEPWNKQTLIIFENKLRNYLESYEQINGSWKSQIPAYHFFELTGSLVLSVNATDNSFISVRNVSEIQVLNLRQDGNLRLDIRPQRPAPNLWYNTNILIYEIQFINKESFLWMRMKRNIQSCQIMD